jgi:hypothetical protein
MVFSVSDLSLSLLTKLREGSEPKSTPKKGSETKFSARKLIYFNFLEIILVYDIVHYYFTLVYFQINF